MKLVKTISIICLIVIVATPLWAQNGQMMMRKGQNACASCPVSQPPSVIQPLNTDEIDYLQFMREEEKLALDIYTAFNEMYKVRVFSNISVSEQRHFDAIGVLINRYGLTDPAQEEAGVFTNPDLQNLYDTLFATGSQSLLYALQVGLDIETKDMEDLQAAIAGTSPIHKDILNVYGNLLSASANHYAAFDSYFEVASSN